MPSDDAGAFPSSRGTLDLIVLRTLATMEPQHAYAIATRLEQVSEDLLHLNQGTLYPALVRLEQQGRIKGTWGETDSNREAKFYAITKAGEKALAQENTARRRMTGLVEKLLTEGACPWRIGELGQNQLFLGF
jgi:transcriptional regulator